MKEGRKKGAHRASERKKKRAKEVSSREKKGGGNKVPPQTSDYAARTPGKRTNDEGETR